MLHEPILSQCSFPPHENFRKPYVWCYVSLFHNWHTVISDALCNNSLSHFVIPGALCNNIAMQWPPKRTDGF